MKSIQNILTIMLVVFLIGMMPNLSDAEVKTIIISPDKFVPQTGEDNYDRLPSYVTSADSSSVRYWAKIKFPNNVNRLKQLIYYHQSFTGSVSVVQIYRSIVGVSGLELIYSALSLDNSGDIIKIREDIPDEPKVDNSWTYWVWVSCSNSDALVYGVKIKVSTR